MNYKSFDLLLEKMNSYSFFDPNVFKFILVPMVKKMDLLYRIQKLEQDRKETIDRYFLYKNSKKTNSLNILKEEIIHSENKNDGSYSRGIHKISDRCILSLFGGYNKIYCGIFIENEKIFFPMDWDDYVDVYTLKNQTIQDKKKWLDHVVLMSETKINPALVLFENNREKQYICNCNNREKYNYEKNTDIICNNSELKIEYFIKIFKLILYLYQKYSKIYFIFKLESSNHNIDFILYTLDKYAKIYRIKNNIIEYSDINKCCFLDSYTSNSSSWKKYKNLS
jgi:hypothetical protein